MYSVVTFYANLGEEAIGYGLQQTSVSHLVTEGRLVPTIKKIASKCPKLKHIIYTTHLSDPLDLEDITLLQFEEIEKMGPSLYCERFLALFE
jgi:long-subunit acyl-CoA synthetase (AMP-forming)